MQTKIIEMKASIKLRAEEQKPPLLRAKFPITFFNNLPLTTSFTAGDSSDLSFNLLTSFPFFPSLKLSYQPNPSPNNPNSTPSPFSLTLRSGAGPLGSPTNSPFLISLRLSPSPTNPSFSFHLKPNLGHFSLRKMSPLPTNTNLNPKGGQIEELISTGVGVRVTTGVPVGERAGIKVRWAVRVPPEKCGVWGRLPYLTVDKISVERVEEAEEQQIEVGRETKEWDIKDIEGMKGMCYWMGREVEELKKESGLIRESVEKVKEANARNGNGGAAMPGRRRA